MRQEELENDSELIYQSYEAKLSYAALFSWWLAELSSVTAVAELGVPAGGGRVILRRVPEYPLTRIRIQISRLYFVHLADPHIFASVYSIRRQALCIQQYIAYYSLSYSSILTGLPRIVGLVQSEN